DPPQEIADRIEINRIRIYGDVFGDINLAEAFNDKKPVELPSSTRTVTPLADESTKIFVESQAVKDTPPPPHKTGETTVDDAGARAKAALEKMTLTDAKEKEKTKEAPKKKEIPVTAELEEAFVKLLHLEAQKLEVALNRKFPGQKRKGWAHVVEIRIKEERQKREGARQPTLGCVIQILQEARLDEKTKEYMEDFLTRIASGKIVGHEGDKMLARKYVEELHEQEAAEMFGDEEQIGGGSQKFGLADVLKKLRGSSAAQRDGLLLLERLTTTMASEARKAKDPNMLEVIEQLHKEAQKTKVYQSQSDQEQAPLKAAYERSRIMGMRLRGELEAAYQAVNPAEIAERKDSYQHRKPAKYT
ncbi:hypothetical protein HYZ99_00465, partial [Candidatus Peregrinibacteria bacterium]|nr:hypothetical protein [Candidatus Peregrinibacteria bacterium]